MASPPSPDASGEPSATVAGAEAAYRNQLGDWIDATNWLAEEMRAALITEQVTTAHQEARTKTSASLSRNLRSRSRLPSLASLFRGEHDLIGLRVVVYVNDDKAKVKACLERLWGDADASERAEWLPAYAFGYRTMHLKFEIPDPGDKAKFPWFERTCREGSFEVQVRTLAEHAWAATEHRFQYKAPMAPTEDVRRALYRVSAVLEAVDVAVADLSDAINERLESAGQAVWSGDLNGRLDRFAALVLVRTHETVGTVLNEAVDAGFGLQPRAEVDPAHAGTDWRDAIHSDAVKREMDAAADLAAAAINAGLHTPGALIRALEGVPDRPAVLARLIRGADTGQLDLLVPEADLLTLLLCTAVSGDVLPKALADWSRAVAESRDRR